MKKREEFIDQLLSVTPDGFEELALEVFHYQYIKNTLYRQFCDLQQRTPATITSVRDIPFLPITFFKRHLVSSYRGTPVAIFESSTTTGTTPSRHVLYDAHLYSTTSKRGFDHVFSRPVSDFEWLALLPSYLDRSGASLVHMVHTFIESGGGGFFRNNYIDLRERLLANMRKGRPTILIGVTFALLEFAERFPMDLRNVQIIETGGMKGRREELTRMEVHDILKVAFNVDQIGSEYGMTELLSQGWSLADGLYTPSPTLRIRTRAFNDPYEWVGHGQRGAVNCIDLANIDTCAFIATEDIGITHGDGTFEILGRLDGSEQRGCNLMFYGDG